VLDGGDVIDLVRETTVPLGQVAVLATAARESTDFILE